MIVRSPASSHVKAAGSVLLILGAWAALIPFFGPSIGVKMGTSAAAKLTESTVTLHLLPGIATVLGGLLLLARRRPGAALGAGLAVAGGVWSVIGPSVHPLWAGHTMSGGMMSMGSSATSNAISALAYHYGIGALISVVAAYALGGPHMVRDSTEDGPPAARPGATAPAEAAGHESSLANR